MMRIDNAVLNVLEASEIEGNQLRLTGQLDRKLYVKTNEVLEAAGGKWNRKAKAHIFPCDAADLMDQIILTGEVDKPSDFDYFPTPDGVVQQLIDLAEFPKDAFVKTLEPSAGEGAILSKIPWMPGSMAIEINEKRAGSLRNKYPQWVVECCDFLNWSDKEAGKFLRIVMNPPFSKQADIRHVNHAYNFLADGGILVSVMSSGVIFRENELTAEFRELLETAGGEIYPLPEGAFKESGTMVNTVIVKIRK